MRDVANKPGAEGRNGPKGEDKRDKIPGPGRAESLLVTNPAVANMVLADLQYPAETRQACKGLQNKEGSISVKDLKSLLIPRGRPVSKSAGVPAEHARALVESIIARGSGTNGKESAPGGTLASVRIKAEGSYTPEEFRSLMEKVVQQADTNPGAAWTVRGPSAQSGFLGENGGRFKKEARQRALLKLFFLRSFQQIAKMIRLERFSLEILTIERLKRKTQR